MAKSNSSTKSAESKSSQPKNNVEINIDFLIALVEKNVVQVRKAWGQISDEKKAEIEALAKENSGWFDALTAVKKCLSN